MTGKVETMAMQKSYLIESTEEKGLFWNNSQGWVDAGQADSFSKLESESLSLPIGGKWILGKG